MEGESLEKITEVVQHPDYLDKVISDGRSKLFKLENIVHGGFDIATILEKSSKDARIKAEVGGNIRKDIARVLIPLRRKKGLSQVQFDQYWLNTHAPLMEKFLLATSVSKYEQLHVRAEPSGDSFEWDGIAIFEADSIAKLFEVFAEENFMKLSGEDGVNFLSNQVSEILPCDLITLIDK